MRARVLFTNGTATLQLYWLEHRGSDVYHGSIASPKNSYHASGQVHSRGQDGEFIEKRLHTPLREITGRFTLGSLLFKNSPSWFEGETLGRHRFRGTKVDTLLTLDGRSLPASAYLLLTVGLLEPGQLGFLSPTTEDKHPFLELRQILVDTSVTPWVWARVITIPDLEPNGETFFKEVLLATMRVAGADEPLEQFAFHWGPLWSGGEE